MEAKKEQGNFSRTRTLRPSTSASLSRPFQNDEKESTSNPGFLLTSGFPHDLEEQHQNILYEDEEDDSEDVFAFLPPFLEGSSVVGRSDPHARQQLSVDLQSDSETLRDMDTPGSHQDDPSCIPPKQDPSLPNHQESHVRFYDHSLDNPLDSSVLYQREWKEKSLPYGNQPYQFELKYNNHYQHHSLSSYLSRRSLHKSTTNTILKKGNLEAIHNEIIPMQPIIMGQHWDSVDLLKIAPPPTTFRCVELENEDEQDSPYPEVRASVSNVDDPTMPVITIRSLFLGITVSIMIAAFNALLQERDPPTMLTPIVALIILHPIGKFLAYILPIYTIHVPKWLGGFGFSLNPGVWNIKEHTVVMIATTVGAQPAYSIALLFSQQLPWLWDEQRPFIYSFLFICGPQLVSLGLAGFARKLLVEPASMIWPNTLVTSTILNTLHAEEEPVKGRISRMRLFVWISLGSFCFYFLPGLLFQSMSYLNWVCWIWPDNVPVNVVFGVVHGLGLSLITLDWNQITFLGNPLCTPWWAQVNILIGFVLSCCIAAPIIYFTNTLYTAYLPFHSSRSFDRYGQPYNTSMITLDGKTFSPEKYAEYSPVYISASLMMTYFGGFAVITAALVHTALHHGNLIWNELSSRGEEKDVHAKLISKYRQVPWIWNLALLVIALCMCTVVVACFDVALPIWGLALSLVITVVYLIPFGIINAMTNLPGAVNLVSELVASYLFPGKPLPVMMFKTFSQETLGQALLYSENMKLAHYLKIPPRQVWMIQIVTILIGSVVQVMVKDWMIQHISNICTPTQDNHFTCPGVNMFYTASLLWGAIGAPRTFGFSALYHNLLYGLLLGAIVPFVFWLGNKKFPNSGFQYLCAPVLFIGMSTSPPGSGINVCSFVLVGFLTQYYLKKRNLNWWSRFNYITAGALELGTLLSTFLICLLLQLSSNVPNHLDWWGNKVFLNTADAQARSWVSPPQTGFGPFPGQF